MRSLIIWTLALTFSGLGIGIDATAATFETRALTGDPVPGAPADVVLSRFENPQINAKGEISFLSNLAGPSINASNNQGAFTDGGGNLRLVARTGDAAPGTAPGVVFSSVGITTPDNNGRLTFRGSLTGTGANSTNDVAVYSDQSGALELVAREGDTAPGTEPGVVFDQILIGPFVGADGTMLLSGRLRGTGIDFFNNAVLYAGNAGALTLAGRADDPAPHIDAPYFNFTARSVNATGQIAFEGQALVTGSGGRLLYKGAPNALSSVVQSSSNIPPLDADLRVGGFDGYEINNAGHATFRSSVLGLGSNEDNNRAIWSDRSGLLELIIRENDDALDAGPGVVFRDPLRPVANGTGHIAIATSLDGPGVTNANDTAIFSDVAGALSMIVREGDVAPGTDPGVHFGDLLTNGIFYSGLVHNSDGFIAFLGTLTGAGVDASNDTGIWASDAAGNIEKIARMGDLFDVNDDPGIVDLRTIADVSFLMGNGNESGRGASFNDNGQLAIRLGFTDGTEGIFVATIPEPASGFLLCAVGVLTFARRRGHR